MVEPVIVLTAVIAAVAGAALLPAACASVVRLMRAALPSGFWGRRSRAALVVALTAVLARPTAVVATTPPPLLRLPLPVGGGGGPAELRLDVAGRHYVVVPGDSLWAISARHLRGRSGDAPSDVAVDRAWRLLYAANRDVVGANPDLIYPGQTLTIPEEW